MAIEYQTYLATRAFRGNPSHFELNFPAGAIVIVPAGLDGAKIWWGQYLNHSGLFPASYVRSIEKSADDSKTAVLPVSTGLVKTFSRDNKKKKSKLSRRSSRMKRLDDDNDGGVHGEKNTMKLTANTEIPQNLNIKPQLNLSKHQGIPNATLVVLFGANYREDVCFAFLGKRRPKLPLREELRSLGFEVVLRPIYPSKNIEINFKRAIGYEKYNKKLEKAFKNPQTTKNIIVRAFSRWMHNSAVESRDPVDENKHHLPDGRFSSPDDKIKTQKTTSRRENVMEESKVSFQLSELFCGNYSIRKINSVLVNNVIAVQFRDTDSDISSTTEHYGGYESNDRDQSPELYDMEMYPRPVSQPKQAKDDPVEKKTNIIDKNSQVGKSYVDDTITFIFIPTDASEVSSITKPIATMTTMEQLGSALSPTNINPKEAKVAVDLYSRKIQNLQEKSSSTQETNIDRNIVSRVSTTSPTSPRMENAVKKNTDIFPVRKRSFHKHNNEIISFDVVRFL